MPATHALEVQHGSRFEFGKNWARFLSVLSDERIAMAEQSLRRMLDVRDLRGQRFLDIGSGSGLFSLAARRMGARVHSFDYDPHSVACTQELKRRYFPDDPDWVIEEGSVLDTAYLRGLGRHDVVYSWGVLHHTGAMWQALENAIPLVTTGGKLCIALYNDQGLSSRMWWRVKRAYNAIPVLRPFLLALALVQLWGPAVVLETLRGRPGRPFAAWRDYSKESARGMNAWFDLKDWVGGLPFEVARPDTVFHFYRRAGFELRQLKTSGSGHGCNEFVFLKTTDPGVVRPTPFAPATADAT